MTEKRIDHPKGFASALIREVAAPLRSGGTIPLRFEITTSSGYRATLTACGRDECREGTVIPCPKPETHSRTSNPANREHNRSHCHAWHWPSIERFAGEVLKTYGAKTRPGQVGVPRGSIHPWNFAGAR
ncbi:hypothetical protein [Micromonospora sp. WMMD1082]|uniref:hypothetical protein n=1 Tax=Micromonospora sp. WMMD1082 TaxID=3016104 RepID=UPI0024174CFA|nr:hypothetical protein [Micromonospora sp. WMMD1082]MDG4792732.1 hypothetical protein [Micromonospora sp. WMMD1082]